MNTANAAIEVPDVGRHTQQAHELLGELSHNLQTLLAVLKARIERLRFSVIRESGMHDPFSEVDESIETLSRAIAEVLAIAVYPEGSDKWLQGQEPFSLSALLEDVVSDIRGMAEMQGISVHFQIEEGIVITGNRRAIHDAVMNILGNAVKYMGNSEPRDISIFLEQENRHTTLTVSDTGIGILPEDLPHIFKRFYRSGRVYGKAPGLGLGLASVARTVDTHGGTISVTSDLGIGTTFTVRLPL